MSVAILRGDARRLPLPDGCVDLIVTSPPYYGLRAYTDAGEVYGGQIGSEATPAEYVTALVECTREWVRVLKPSGSLFVNLGDKYAGSDGTKGGTSASTLDGGRSNGRPRAFANGTFDGGGRRVPGQPKSLLGLPWRYALACMDQLGLILRAEIVWAKSNGLPESVTDRVRRAHEQVFHFTRQPRYYSAVDEIREPTSREGWTWADRKLIGHQKNPDAGHNYGGPGMAANPLGKLPGSVWTIPSAALVVPAHLGVDHFAAFPPALVRPIVLGWSPPGVCTACGEGRRPVVDRVTSGHDNKLQSPGDGRRTTASSAAPWNSSRSFWAFKMAHGGDRITGYACACARPDAPTRPAVVLVPFGGTGTTALVATVHGRHGITVDASADYCRLAAWRCHDPGERARALDVPKPPPIPEGQDALFALPP